MFYLYHVIASRQCFSGGVAISLAKGIASGEEQLHPHNDNFNVFTILRETSSSPHFDFQAAQARNIKKKAC
jgi:hypothetical protein